jgi:hypothetical protein
VGVNTASWRADATLDVLDVIAQLARHCDFGTVDDYMSLMANDAVWEMPDNSQVGVAASRRAGHGAIRAGVEERRAGGFQGPGTNTLHIVASIAVDVVDQRSARSHAYWLYYVHGATTPVLRSVGQYDDVFIRDQTAWKLHHRRISIG